MSETISSGGFSSASGVLAGAGRRRRRGPRAAPLYSHAKWCRFQTSAQPSPPVSFRVPRSKQVRLARRVGSPSSRHRSRECSCDAERSFNSDARHFRDEGVQCHAAARARESAPPRPTTTPSGRPSTASAAPPGRALQPPGHRARPVVGRVAAGLEDDAGRVDAGVDQAVRELHGRSQVVLGLAGRDDDHVRRPPRSPCGRPSRMSGVEEIGLGQRRPQVPERAASGFSA